VKVNLKANGIAGKFKMPTEEPIAKRWQKAKKAAGKFEKTI